MGITNPKITVCFVAVLPQFVDFGGGQVPGQMIVLGLVFGWIVVALGPEVLRPTSMGVPLR